MPLPLSCNVLCDAMQLFGGSVLIFADHTLPNQLENIATETQGC